MDALIFFAIIIFFSILESIAKRKKGRVGGPTELPEGWESDEETWQSGEVEDTRSRDLPTYDAEPSYDDLDQQTGRTPQRAGRSGSEGLIPSELWDEIAKLAERAQRGRSPTGQTPTPSRAEPRTAPAPTAGRRAGSLATRRGATTGQSSPTRARGGAPQHRVHLAHADYGTDPSERAPSAQDGLDPLARALGADAGAARSQLRRRGRHALRQAVIMHEVLGPPASLRPDHLEDRLAE